MISAKEKQLKQETNNNNNNSNYSKTQIQTPPTENMKTFKKRRNSRNGQNQLPYRWDEMIMKWNKYDVRERKREREIERQNLWVKEVDDVWTIANFSDDAIIYALSLALKIK